MERIIVNLADVDITNLPEFEEYVKFKELYRFELASRDFPRTYLPPEIKSQQQTLSNALHNLSPSELRKKADELIRAQNLNQKHSDLISIITSDSVGRFDLFNTLQKPMFWATHEEHTPSPKVKVGNQTIDAFDLDYIIAESLQQLYASEDPLAEYHGWITRQNQIEVNINSDGTTEDEIVERNVFIEFLNDRETEIKRVMTLYAGAAFNSNSRHQIAAQEKLKFLVFKLSELRRLRERTENTKSRADNQEQLDNIEQQKQKEALATTGALVMAGLTAEMISMGNNKIKQNDTHNLLERGPAESIVSMRPITKTVEQALDKIQSAKEHRNQMFEILSAMRNGISLDEWRKNRQEGKEELLTSEQIRNLVNYRQSNFVQRFTDYTRDVTG